MEGPPPHKPLADLPYGESQVAGPSSPSSDQADVLQRVLDQSISRLSDESDPIPIDLESLLAIARRHAGSPLTLEPIAVELVEAVLTEALGWGWQRPEQWRPLSRQLAQTVINDGRSFERMERLWRRLNAAVMQSGH